MQFMVPFLRELTSLDIPPFLYGFPPGGILEAMITPSDLVSRFAKSGVMTMDFIVGCILRDMAMDFGIFTDGNVKTGERVVVKERTE